MDLVTLAMTTHGKSRDGWSGVVERSTGLVAVR